METLLNNSGFFSLTETERTEIWEGAFGTEWQAEYETGTMTDEELVVAMQLQVTHTLTWRTEAS